MNRGIVLRSHLAHSAKLIIFDELQGKITAYSRAGDKPLRAPCGALLTYNYVLWRDMMMLECVEIKQMPCITAHGNAEQGLSLQFIHQVLELLAAFMPLCLPVPELFSKIFMLYTEQAEEISATQFRQHLFLCRMLAALGIYPEESTYLRSHVVRCLILSPFEFMVDHEDTSIHNALESWLKQCLVTHPTVSAWKTLK